MTSTTLQIPLYSLTIIIFITHPVFAFVVSLSSNKLANIEEETPANWLPAACPPPETPTETMEFLGRSWSLSAMELSKALSYNHAATTKNNDTSDSCHDSGIHQLNQLEKPRVSVENILTKEDSPPPSPRGSDDTKLYRSIIRGKTLGRRMKDQKERKKHENRTHNAQLHAAVSVVGVAAAVAALTASSVTSSDTSHHHRHHHHDKEVSRTSAAIASAAALVASHCIEIAEDMGADHEQILAAVGSAINARTNGDIMTLTAGAATALRGAATLRARLQKGGSTIAMVEEQIDEKKESNISIPLNFVSKGGELLKLTRKGDLHWKQVSFRIKSNWQVVVKMKSKHMAGTFTKKKKCIVSAVYPEIRAWAGREREEGSEKWDWFAIKTCDRIIEFECKSKIDKQMWVQGIQYMLQCRTNI